MELLMEISLWRRLRLATLVLCLFLAVAAGAGEKPVLYIYTWSDYFDADVIADFEDAFDCQVAIDYFDSNEAMYAKLKAGAGGYDIITPSSYMSQVMNAQGMLLKLDHDKIANLDNIEKINPALMEDPDFVYNVPYTRTVIGVGYNAKRLGALPETWDVFSREDAAKRMTMLNDMREAIGAALKYLGYSLNTTDTKELDEAKEQLRKWKKNLAKFEVDEAKIGLGSGEFLIIHGYNGDIALIMQENEDIQFMVPNEGTSVAFDDFVIMANSKNPDLAHEFINYFLDPETAAANMEDIRYYMPNPKAVAMLPEELRESSAFALDDATLAKCEVIRDLGADNAKYIQVWEQVKAAGE